MAMRKKIDKNYLGDALKHLDLDHNQIIDPDEWLSYFEQFLPNGNITQAAQDLMTAVLEDIFPSEHANQLATLAEAIIKKHSIHSQDGHQIELMRLYNYLMRFIAPQKYKQYQETLEDKTEFFLYDGIIQREEFEIFTDQNNRVTLADLFYLIVSYQIPPLDAGHIIGSLVQENQIDFNIQDFTLDADAVFECLSLQKENITLIDVDGILKFAQKKLITCQLDHVIHLFGIHNDLRQKIIQLGRVDQDTALCFLNYQHQKYLELALNAICESLNIEVNDPTEIIKIFNFLGYTGRPGRIFKELAGQKKFFDQDALCAFLNDNQIDYSVKQ